MYSWDMVLRESMIVGEIVHEQKEPADFVYTLIYWISFNLQV